MVMGLKYGRTRADDVEAKERAYSLLEQFIREFESRNGSIVCRELLGCDIGTPEGSELARDQDLYTTRCRGFVRDAAEIVEGMLG